MPIFAQRARTVSELGPGMTFLFGAISFLILIWILWTLIRLVVGRDRVGSLVLQSAELDAMAATEEHVYVDLVGRHNGFVAFLLSLIGLDAIMRLVVTESEVRCLASSVSGRKTATMPLGHVAQVKSGIEKPATALYVATLFIFQGVGAFYVTQDLVPPLINVVIALVCVIFYFLRKRYFIDIYSSGGPPIQLRFRPGVLDGMVLDEKRLSAVVRAMRDIVNAGRSAEMTDRSSKPIRKPKAAETALTRSDEQPVAHKERLTVTAEVLEDESEETNTDDEYARELFHHAKNLAQSGKQREAMEVLRDIARRFEGSHYAEKAKLYLKNGGAAK